MKNEDEDESQVYFRTNGTNVVISDEWVLPVPVANSHTLVSFTFETTGGDINFSMVFIGLNSEEEVLIPPERIQSDVEPFEDSIELETPGTLILLWDNSYSWLHKKELSYSLQIERDPDVDAYGMRKEAPLSALENFRISQVINKRKHLLDHISNVQQRLSGVEEILKNVTNADIEELELSILRIREEIDMKKKLLKTSREEKKELKEKLGNFDRYRAPLNIRLLSSKNLAHILQFLDPAETSLVCKYWCQLTAYIIEREENPTLTDDDFEILFDYEPAKSLTHMREALSTDEVRSEKPENVHNGSVGTDALSHSEGVTTVTGGPVSIHGTSSYSEGDDDNSFEPSIMDILNSLSENHDNGKLSSLKKMKVSDYPDDIKNYMRTVLSSISRMEDEKFEIKTRIDQWKLKFERRYHRPPSDQEKMTNISSYFQKYSKLKRAIKVEEEKIFKITNAIDKLQS